MNHRRISRSLQQKVVPSSEWRQLDPKSLICPLENREPLTYPAASHLRTHCASPCGTSYICTSEVNYRKQQFRHFSGEPKEAPDPKVL
ncbi:hypothetical protein AVEN_189425-1 [Araneus ventricosus]|uniref:Uncharacterized protein n=1 Tax=Araneus ventricosus TaxID=182803 RepID=A0A4Y2WYD5_ARAVE|nr:hypothetical protein AVEN_193288-1 [Araneus ventricosus]GBO40882.1 hypothetical protein AVEN_189425-1 [Araneus ventricosus]